MVVEFAAASVAVASQGAVAAEPVAAQFAVDLVFFDPKALAVAVESQAVVTGEPVAAGIQVSFHIRFASAFSGPVSGPEVEVYSFQHSRFFFFPSTGRFSSYASFD